jgi:3-hydroxyacyl-[acyl-carrier-protein] dehydratase
MSDTTEARGEQIGYAEVLHRIPHRYPFLLIDRAESYVANESTISPA